MANPPKVAVAARLPPVGAELLVGALRGRGGA